MFLERQPSRRCRRARFVTGSRRVHRARRFGLALAVLDVRRGRGAARRRRTVRHGCAPAPAAPVTSSGARSGRPRWHVQLNARPRRGAQDVRAEEARPADDEESNAVHRRILRQSRSAFSTLLSRPSRPTSFGARPRRPGSRRRLSRRSSGSGCARPRCPDRCGSSRGLRRPSSRRSCRSRSTSIRTRSPPEDGGAGPQSRQAYPRGATLGICVAALAVIGLVPSSHGFLRSPCGTGDPASCSRRTCHACWV